jgi:tRNA threonylcarbamoyladenosine biosynthesis protein TsaE
LSSILETSSQRGPDEAACALSAEALARHASLTSAFIELHGPLGAGKTTFVRHLLHALGVQGRVKSPTYALMESYEIERNGAVLPIWHFDFYRFDDPQEWEDAGFRDVFAAVGLKLVEWPEKAEGLLPRADLRIFIEPEADEQRSVSIEAHTPLGLELIA